MEQLNKLGLGEKLFCGGSFLLLLSALILNWFSFNSFGYGGFDYPGGTWLTFAVIVSVALSGLLLAINLGNMAPPNLPAGWTWGMVYGAGAGLTLVLVLLKCWRILAAPAGGFAIEGFLIGAIATGLIAYGGYTLYLADKGGGFASLRKQ